MCPCARSLELSDVRQTLPGHPELHTQLLFLNGRYVRYVHIPDSMEIVGAVHHRVVAQKKAMSSHRRTADVIREAIARRDTVRNSSLAAVKAVTDSQMHVTAASEFQDLRLQCRSCGQTFTWSAGEQRQYKQNGLKNQPQRCVKCLRLQRTQRLGKQGHARKSAS